MTKAVQLPAFVWSTSTVLITPVVSACDVTSQRDTGGTQAPFSSGRIFPMDLRNAIRDSQCHARADDGPHIIHSDGSISFAAEGIRLTAPTTKEYVQLESDLSEKSQLSLEVFELKLRLSLRQKFAVIVLVGLGAHFYLVNQSKVNATLVRTWKGARA